MTTEIKDKEGNTTGYVYDQGLPSFQSKVDLHTPPHFRYPATTDELLEFGRDYFQGCLKIAEERNKRYALPTAPFRNFDLCGEYGFATRISDKCSRLVTLTEPGNVVDDGGEAVEDTLIDLANYAMLLAAYRANKRGNNG